MTWRLLLVDDNAITRKMVRFALERRGYEVHEAGDGAEAMEQVRSAPPDLILLDLMLGELSGFDVARALRDGGFTNPILALSGFVSRLDEARVPSSGFDDVIVKPIEPSRLLVIVEAHLGKGAANRERLASQPDGSVAAAADEASHPPASAEAPDPSLERERMQRVIRQLQRQVELNGDVTRRSATLGAELTMLHRISEALTRDTDLESALDTVLAACFDAGGISHGTLYLIEPDDELQVRAFGNVEPRGDIGSRRELEAAIAERAATSRGSRHERPDMAGRAFIPLTRGDELLGALFLVSSTSSFERDRLEFAEGVANQLALSIALTRTFAARAASERDARTQFAILRSVFDGISDAVVVVDRAGVFLHWNTAASDQFALAPRAPRPSEWPEAFGLHRPDGRRFDWHDLPLVRAMRGARVDREEIYRPHHKPDGGWLAVTARPLFDDHGEAAGAVAVFRDVTHEHESRAHELASERMASVGLIAAGVAHEINNPLAAASANTEFALSILGEEGSSVSDADLVEVRQVLADSMEALRRVRDIVKDLRVFSRVEEERREPVDLIPVLRSSVRMALNELRHRARVVELLEPVAPVIGNEARLGQVLLNLLVNAAHAIPEGNVAANKVTLRTSMRGESEVVVSIEDTGGGMSEEVRGRLFSPFFTTKSAGQGTGLGLSICQRIVTDFGGHLEVESEPGRGSTFRVVLPAVASQVPSARPVRDESAEVSCSVGARILVLDDDALVARTVTRALGTHDVFAERSGGAALARIEAGEEFDLIICDVMMPAMSGEQFYRLLGELDPALRTRVLFLTGGAFTQGAREFLDGVPNLRLDKPFALGALRECVERALRRVRKRAEPSTSASSSRR